MTTKAKCDGCNFTVESRYELESLDMPGLESHSCKLGLVCPECYVKAQEYLLRTEVYSEIHSLTAALESLRDDRYQNRVSPDEYVPAMGRMRLRKVELAMELRRLFKEWAANR